jgi:hypothetical protein
MLAAAAGEPAGLCRVGATGRVRGEGGEPG